MPARGHRADEDAAVGVEIDHADAIAEDGAAGERRGRIDGDDSDALLLRAVVLRQRRHERRLAGAGRAGDADDARAAGSGIELGQEELRVGSFALDEGDGAAEGAEVAGDDVGGEVGHDPFSRFLAITIR